MVSVDETYDPKDGLSEGRLFPVDPPYRWMDKGKSYVIHGRGVHIWSHSRPTHYKDGRWLYNIVYVGLRDIDSLSPRDNNVDALVAFAILMDAHSCPEKYSQRE